MLKQISEIRNKFNANAVGADDSVCINFEEQTQNKKSSKTYSNSTSYFTHLTSKKGITLIALVITIIIMLILVAVTITVALKGGLFTTAKQAKEDTQNEINAEEKLSNGRVKIDGKWYNSVDDYINGKVAPLPSYEEAQKDGNGFLEENATLTEGDYTATIPTGFKISEKEGEGNIETGLVIQDARGNEFVWIPVTTDLEYSYSYNNDSNYYEPKELQDKYEMCGNPFDSQEILDYLYGKDYYKYVDFKYKDEYKEMVDSVNEYDGFYIGRYETTIDGNSIGSKENKTVLTAGAILKEGTNPNNSEPYYYRWYGLYAEQKKADVIGNGQDIQTAMIYGVLWDETMNFIRKQNEAGKTNYTVDTSTSSWHHGSSLVNSGQLNPGENGDVALNIWDLECNGKEWTQEATSSQGRVSRGGFYSDSFLNYKASISRMLTRPHGDGDYDASRLTLYIKN